MPLPLALLCRVQMLDRVRWEQEIELGQLIRCLQLTSYLRLHCGEKIGFKQSYCLGFTDCI